MASDQRQKTMDGTCFPFEHWGEEGAGPRTSHERLGVSMQRFLSIRFIVSTVCLSAAVWFWVSPNHWRWAAVLFFVLAIVIDWMAPDRSKTNRAESK